MVDILATVTYGDERKVYTVVPSKHAPILFFGSRPFIAFPLVLRNIHHPLRLQSDCSTHELLLIHSFIVIVFVGV